MASSQGLIRLQKEYKQICENKTFNYFEVVPDKNNFFIWHYCIYGLKDTDYDDGYYYGKVLFPNEYPMKPPGIIMITESGKFQPHQRICLSISDYHPESWNPMWKTETIMTGLISFMNSDEYSAGCVQTDKATKLKNAKESLTKNMKLPEFAEIFKPLFDKMGIGENGNKKELMIENVNQVTNAEEKKGEEGGNK